MKRMFRAVRWLLLFALRKFAGLLLWVVRKMGLTRLFGMSFGGGLGAYLGGSTGVALWGTAFVGSWFLAPLLGIIGILSASMVLLGLRKKVKKKDEGTP